jgi:hypothetical protein
MSNTHSKKPTQRHTPGPWKYSKLNTPWVNTPTVWVDGQTIAYLPPEHAECEANARLIAAAPHLLYALKKLVVRDAEEAAACGFTDEEMTWLEDARSAIDYTTGESLPNRKGGAQ